MTEQAIPPRKSKVVLWRNRDFLLLWSGQAISILGTSVSTLALPLLVLALTHSPSQAGFIAAAQTVPYLLFSLPAGALVDRWNRKTVMILCDIVRLLAYGSVPLFYLIGPGLSGFIISLAGTIVGGAVFAFLLDSISYFISGLSLSAIRHPFQEERAALDRTSLRRAIVQGIHLLWSNHRIRQLAFLIVCIGFLSSSADLAMIVLAQQQLHASVRLIGFIFSIGSIGGLFGALAAGTITARVSFGPILVGTTVAEAFAVGLLAVAISPIMLMLGLAIISLAIPIFGVTQLSYRLSLIPDAMQGRLNSIFDLLFFGSQPLGVAIGGLLLSIAGPRIVLGSIALGLTLAALVVGLTEVGKG